MKQNFKLVGVPKEYTLQGAVIIKFSWYESDEVSFKIFKLLSKVQDYPSGFRAFQLKSLKFIFTLCIHQASLKFAL